MKFVSGSVEYIVGNIVGKQENVCCPQLFPKTPYTVFKLFHYKMNKP